MKLTGLGTAGPGRMGRKVPVVPWQPVGMGSDSLSSQGAELGAAQAPGLVVGGAFTLEEAAALATSLIPIAAGTSGIVALRLGFGAIGLVVISRPDFRRLSSGRASLLAVVVEAVLAIHHLCLYTAIDCMPRGAARLLNRHQWG